MCCGHESHRGGGHGGHHYGGPCGCGGYADIEPCFWTTKEKIAWLEEYLEDLRAKAMSVEERIVALKGEE
jgi:hypothetical protein